MKANTQRKVLGGVLVLGIAAVCADRFVPRGAGAAVSPDTSEYAVARSPASVSASAPVTAAVSSPLATPTPQANLTAAGHVSLSARLHEAATTSLSIKTLADAFALRDGWIPEAPKPAAPVDRSADIFRDGHRLTGVLASSGRGYAIVDGKIVGVGQSIDGFKLVALSGRSATFESATARTVLTLNSRSGDGAAAVAGAER